MDHRADPDGHRQVRQQPHLVAAALASALAYRGIAFRNEQDSQDLTAEPAAALEFNFIRVIADDRQPDAYADLMRIAARPSAPEHEAARFNGRLKRMIGDARETVRGPQFETADPGAWRTLVHQFLNLVSGPVLAALSAGYQQGTWLDDVFEGELDAFSKELTLDGDPVQALRRLSEADAVRFLTIHNCKGLEFEKVVVLGVEEELFWGTPTEAISEFFVAASRAKHHLVLTHAKHRDRPEGFTKGWDCSVRPTKGSGASPTKTRFRQAKASGLLPWARYPSLTVYQASIMGNGQGFA
ncbi:UvrD-like helicase C-terminal domain-containing protein [Actinacidiphila yanglinensis]|uniref:UvrD-like helicase C-terminal domain-containing protein n=1 Tax=Actinacidiphila yanglinensis TaxID=310779 RepID=A0A1H6ECJ2_9ACTN|nr:3'-5' exonuclease [Actinacidiphila yanglinensis]SEG94739.1 UvrD-like helicase C-terminal domain-containing protein [Actinacidiphila yanglinensis]